MSSNDVSYYRLRAQVERERAESCVNANVAEIHAELARLYEALVEHESLRPKLGLLFGPRSGRTPHGSPSIGQLDGE